MNAVRASASVRCRVTRTQYRTLARRTSGMSGVPVFQAAPVFQMRAKPPRMRTAALVSDVRLPMTFVV